jgi:hypothetical protein
MGSSRAVTSAVTSFFHRRRMIDGVMAGIVVLAIVVLQIQAVTAATLQSASVTMSDSRPNATAVSYDFQTNGVTTSAIKCIKIEFDTAWDGSASKPTGMDISAAALSGTSDYMPTPASWTVSNNNATGVSTITFGTGETPASATSRNLVLSGITNGSTANDDFHLLFSTYNNIDCTSSPVDNVTVSLIYTNGQAVSMTVEGSISFVVAGVTGNGALAVNGATISNGLATTSTTIPFGTLTSVSNKIAAQDLTVSTNYGNGYSVYTRYTGKPTVGTYTIDDHTGSNAAPTAFSSAGAESFGYTTNDASLSGTATRFTATGGNKWAAFTASNAEIAYSSAPVATETTRVGFQAGISNLTEPGAYVTTVTYTAVPVY